MRAILLKMQLLRLNAHSPTRPCIAQYLYWTQCSLHLQLRKQWVYLNAWEALNLLENHYAQPWNKLESVNIWNLLEERYFLTSSNNVLYTSFSWSTSPSSTILAIKSILLFPITRRIAFVQTSSSKLLSFLDGLLTFSFETLNNICISIEESSLN